MAVEVLQESGVNGKRHVDPPCCLRRIECGRARRTAPPGLGGHGGKESRFAMSAATTDAAEPAGERADRGALYRLPAQHPRRHPADLAPLTARPAP